MAEQFDLNPPNSPASSAPVGSTPPPPPKRTWIGVVVGLLLLILALTVVQQVFYKRSSTSGTERTAGKGKIDLGQDLISQISALRENVALERRQLKQDSEVIQKQLGEVLDAAHSQDRRIKRIEQITAEQVSRGSVDEVAPTDPKALPDKLRTLYPAATEFIAKLVTERGIYGGQASQQYLQDWVKSQGATLSSAELRALHDAAQVQRETVPDELVDAVPDLVRKRLAQRVPREDLAAIVRLVWSERENLPTMTAGQLVSVATLVSKSSLSPTATTKGGGDGAAESIVLPDRPIRLSVSSCLISDLPEIICAVAPYLSGGTAVSDQNPALASFLSSRSRQLAREFTQRNSTSPKALLSVVAEQAMRFHRYAAPTPAVSAQYADEGKRQFVTSAAGGIVLARALREGVVDPKRLDLWAQDLVNAIPETVVNSLDLRQVESAYAQLLVRDPLVPSLSPVTIDALDRNLAASLAKAATQLPERRRNEFNRDASIAAATAAVVAARTGATPTVESTAAAIDRAIHLVQIQYLAVDKVAAAIDHDLIPAYSTLFEQAQRRDWTQMAASAKIEAENILADALADSDDGLLKQDGQMIAERVAGSAIKTVEAFLAQIAASDAINGELDRAATNSATSLVKAARTYSQNRVRHEIVPPLTRDRVVRLTFSITQDALAVASGRRRIPHGILDKATADIAAGSAITPSIPTTKPETRPDATGPVGKTDTDSSGIRVIGDDTEVMPTVRKVVIPAGSYGQARVFSGVVCELGNKIPQPMLINLDYSWKGPNDHTMVMRNLRLLADCTAMGGPPRVNAKITKLSYTLPGNRQETLLIDGWAVDDAKGMTGVLGVWDWSIEEVVPLAGTSGALAALAAAFKPNTSVTIVNSNTSQIKQEDQSTGQKAAGGAAEGVADTANDYIKRTLANINPAISVRNNQAVTVVLQSDAVLSIPVAAWNQVVEETTTTASGGFSH